MEKEQRERSRANKSRTRHSGFRREKERNVGKKGETRDRGQGKGTR